MKNIIIKSKPAPENAVLCVDEFRHKVKNMSSSNHVQIVNQILILLCIGKKCA